MRKAAILLLLAAAAWAAAGQKLWINGRPAAHGLLQQGGKSWVCVEDLKASGAQVTTTGEGLSIRFQADGGTQQLTAVEGKPDEWLFNGLWRLQASKPTLIRKPYSGEPGTPGWGLEVEFRNGASKEVSLQQTGVQLPTLALTNGTVLKADEGDWQLISFRALLPGATVKHQLKFYFPHGTPDGAADKAVRLVVPVDPKFGLLRDTGLRYSVPAPSFRIGL